ncbi:MAG: hypothetical protein QX199_13510 [Methylococcaceae bacterium]
MGKEPLSYFPRQGGEKMVLVGAMSCRQYGGHFFLSLEHVTDGMNIKKTAEQQW